MSSLFSSEVLLFAFSPVIMAHNWHKYRRWVNRCIQTTCASLAIGPPSLLFFFSPILDPFLGFRPLIYHVRKIIQILGVRETVNVPSTVYFAALAPRTLSPTFRSLCHTRWTHPDGANFAPVCLFGFLLVKDWVLYSDLSVSHSRNKDYTRYTFPGSSALGLQFASAPPGARWLSGVCSARKRIFLRGIPRFLFCDGMYMYRLINGEMYTETGKCTFIPETGVS